MVTLFRKFDRLLGAIETVFVVLAGGMMITILAIISANIVRRGIWDKGIVWVWPWAEVLFVWMVMIGFFVVYRQKRYMEIDFVARLCGPVGMAVTRIISQVGILSMTGLILYYAPTLFGSQSGEIDIVGLPRYAIAIPMYVSAGLVFLNSLAELIKAVLGDPEVSHSAHF
ncbi:TRAP transporter small permease [Ruegeria sp. Ofav3-42]|uniref:TRAP transporter small permease n=1 Tax=Ruegeria sp. Ofav3-42 TaxID=2917759 RepID=UPI001EF4A573|nr:TRAP transporter small permease subunit [Ruegeria sp. Ofav3-42]MCG7522792.1 TRAP transporter small permease subunit [Ruegeria sp. Ofav3-42]